MPTAELPKYEQVKRSLIQEIELGRWVEGGPIPSEHQLLQRFSVSRPTLVRSLQELVREGYLHRRQGKGTFVAEREGRAKPRNGNTQAARALPVFAAGTDAQALLRPGEVLRRLLRGVQSVLGAAHVDLALRYASAGPVDDETHRFLDKAGPGVALVVEPSFSPQLLIELVRRGWTVWSVNEPWKEGNCVYIDQEHSAYIAARYLIEKRGCRRVALFNGTTTNGYWGFGAKLTGYRRALADLGIEPDPALIREADHMIDTEAGRGMMRALITEGVAADGVIGASDSKAIGAMAAAQEAGRRVPEDLVVVGIDDILAERATPPIPAVALPFAEVGRRAAEEALRASASGLRAFQAEILLKPSLVER